MNLLKTTQTPPVFEQSHFSANETVFYENNLKGHITNWHIGLDIVMTL